MADALLVALAERLLVIALFFGRCPVISAESPSNVMALPRNVTLGSVAEVLSLTNEQADRGYPFHLRAQVTLFHVAAEWLFLQDEDGHLC
jgi:hypothetical protein